MMTIVEGKDETMESESKNPVVVLRRKAELGQKGKCYFDRKKIFSYMNKNWNMEHANIQMKIVRTVRTMLGVKITSKSCKRKWKNVY